MPGNLLEISDLIVDFDPKSLKRLPVERQAVLEKFNQNGQPRAASIVANMPARQGILDWEYVDQLLVRVHCEMQRLSEEFQHGRRILEIALPILRAFQKHGVTQPFRVVDIGCGTGFVIRWLAAFRNEIPFDVELIGVDFNRALIDEARRLARSEDLTREFQVVNAFEMKSPGTLFLSTGVLHHFRDEGLHHFFQQHDQPTTRAFAHVDFQPSLLSRPGAWLFHRIRMREPLSRHDGVVSAMRSHSTEVLLEAARTTSFHCGIYSRRVLSSALPRVFQTVVGFLPQLVDDFREALGSRSSRLEEMA